MSIYAMHHGVKTIHGCDDITSYEKAKEAYDMVLVRIRRDILGLDRLEPCDYDHGPNLKIRITKATDGSLYLRRQGDEEDVNDFIAVVLYETDVVRYYPDGTFSVDNCGFNTPTTSSRVNQFTPAGYGFFHERKKLCTRWQPGDAMEPDFTRNGLKFVFCNHDIRLPVDRDRSTSGVGWPE